MATSVFGAPLILEEGDTALTLTTSAQYIAVKPGWQEVKMYCASEWRIAHCPKLVHALYYSASAGTYTDYMTTVTDRSSSTHMPLDAMAATDYLYLGTTDPVAGFFFDIGSNTNDEAAALDWEYCSTAVAPGATIAFTDVAGDSDGTKTTQTLDTDGVYAFTALGEGTIKRSTLGTAGTPLYGKCYWYRFKPSIPLAATVDINEIIPVYKNTNYGWREAGIEYTWTVDLTKTSGFALLATAGTPVLHITWLKHG